MKDYLRKLVGEAPDPWRGRNLVREYLQARILQFLQEGGKSRGWIFHGGTALRFLYGLTRFSEDLDFALDLAQGVDFDFSKSVEKARTWFGAEAYDMNLKIDLRRPVAAAWFRFPGLAAEIGLSPYRTEVLSIKLELDTRPPSGAKTETTVIRRQVLLRLRHYDKAALLAGKLNAVLTRPFAKGRDLYDLMWYLSDPEWPNPNIDFLGAALEQTGWKGQAPTSGNWAKIVSERLETINWPNVVADVKPFLERPEDLTMLAREDIRSLLERKGSGLNI